MAATHAAGLRIAVCIKQVPDTAKVTIDHVTGTLRRDAADSIINPYDLYALGAALELARAFAGSSTVALSMGPPQAREVLREAVALGITEAVHLQDTAFAGADTWATGLVLSAACKRLGANIIICGKQAIDGDTAQVGPGIAAHLGWAQACCVCAVHELRGSSNCAKHTPSVPESLTVERLLDNGRQTLRVPLPAVLTVVPEVIATPYATLAGKMRARRYEPQIWGGTELDLPPEQTGLRGSFTRVQRITTPPPRGKGEIITGTSLEEKAARLARIIRQSAGGK